MALFDIEETFIGLTDAQFLAKVAKLDLKAKEKLYIKAKDVYYDGDPIMSDSQFDTLEEDLNRAGSKVTGQVGGGDDSAGKLIHAHYSPMLSLSKEQVNDEDNFAQTIKNILAFFKGVWPLEGSAKYDGNAVELQYANGNLMKAVTRGKNGKGKDISTAMKLIVPAVIASNKTLEVRGEIVMPLQTFAAKYSKVTGKGDEARYANARNMVGGVFNDDSIPAEKINDCVFVAYSVKMIDVDGTIKHVEDAMNNLRKLGFNNVYTPPLKTINNATELRAVYDYFKQYRADGEMQLDGIVLKMPESQRPKFGENNHHPKWALAIKFPSKTCQTRLKFHPPYGVEWNVGSTGELTPVGILEPVELDGSMVSRVSLYNKGKMTDRGLFAGALVTIKKSGDIIPAIIKVDEPSPRTKEFVDQQNFYPTECPACNSKLEIENQHIRCINYDCIAKKSQKLANALQALGIKGLGESTCNDLYKRGVKDIFDFFDSSKMNESYLTHNHTPAGLDAVFTPGRSLDIILNASKSTRAVDLDKVILALQLPRVGRTISKEVAKMFAGVRYSFDGLESDVVKPFLVDSSKESHLVQKLVQILRDRGVTINMPVAADVNAIGYEMTGKTTETQFKTKEELVEFLKTKGYVHTKIKDAKILLTDSYDSKSSKMGTAKKKGIQILTYIDLLDKL